MVLGEAASSSSEMSAASFGEAGVVRAASTHTPWLVTVSIWPLGRAKTASPAAGAQLAGWLCTHTGGPEAAAVRLKSISGSPPELPSM